MVNVAARKKREMISIVCRAHKKVPILKLCWSSCRRKKKVVYKLCAMVSKKRVMIRFSIFEQWFGNFGPLGRALKLACFCLAACFRARFPICSMKGTNVSGLGRRIASRYFKRIRLAPEWNTIHFDKGISSFFVSCFCGSKPIDFISFSREIESVELFS